jgi:hypothetical protein
MIRPTGITPIRPMTTPILAPADDSYVVTKRIVNSAFKHKQMFPDRSGFGTMAQKLMKPVGTVPQYQ